MADNGDLTDLFDTPSGDSASVPAEEAIADQPVDDLSDLFDDPTGSPPTSAATADGNIATTDDLFADASSDAVPGEAADEPQPSEVDDLSDLFADQDEVNTGEPPTDANDPLIEADPAEPLADVADVADDIDPNPDKADDSASGGLDDLFSDPIGAATQAGDPVETEPLAADEPSAVLANTITDETPVGNHETLEDGPEPVVDLHTEPPAAISDSPTGNMNEPDIGALASDVAAEDAVEPQLGSSEGAELFNLGKEVAGGRAFFEAGDPTAQAADRLGEFPGTRKYDMHGDPEHVYIDGKPLTAAEFADVVRNDPNWNGEPITLFACETGKQPDGGGAPFAQQLSDELGVPVHAPTELAWSNGAPCYASAEQDAYGNSRPKNPPDGELKSFQPKTGEQTDGVGDRRQVDDDRKADAVKPVGAANPEQPDTPSADQADEMTSSPSSALSETIRPTEHQDERADVEPGVDEQDVDAGDRTAQRSSEPAGMLPPSSETRSPSETTSSGALVENVAGDSQQSRSRSLANQGAESSEGLPPPEEVDEDAAAAWLAALEAASAASGGPYVAHGHSRHGKHTENDGFDAAEDRLTSPTPRFVPGEANKGAPKAHGIWESNTLEVKSYKASLQAVLAHYESVYPGLNEFTLPSGAPTRLRTKTVEHRTSVDHGKRAMSGAARVNVGGGRKVYESKQLEPFHGVTRVRAGLSWDEVQGRWIVTQHFPTSEGWNNGVGAEAGSYEDDDDVIIAEIA